MTDPPPLEVENWSFDAACLAAEKEALIAPATAERLDRAVASAPCTKLGMFGGPCSATGGFKHPECAVAAVMAELRGEG